ncbi:hypothetical protein R5R35_004841 [Gryllus longicercus]|uniref:Uncharacterized protein n=1 Tax=Gryllus longicercus TaxID=2509291 RepID=A0AAN9VMG9_9ORTH
MEEINILSESIIKIESVKEEPVDVNDDDCWNDYVRRRFYRKCIWKL